MIEPLLLTQRAYDDATSGTDSRAAVLIAAVERINEASHRLAVSTAAETFRSFACPEANPLNEDAA